MSDPDAEAWKDATSGRERVRAVVEILEEPASVSEIAERADVAWATADSELERLVAENRATERDVDGSRKYAPNPVQQFLDQVLALIEEHDRDELERRLVDHQSRLESLREEHDAPSASEFRERLAAEDPSAAEMREIRTVASTWEALETERRLLKQALNFYDDVTRLSETGQRGDAPA